MARRVAGALQRLREAREAAGLSQRALAELAGIEQSSVCEYEIGRHVPTLPRLVRLLEALNVDDFRI